MSPATKTPGTVRGEVVIARHVAAIGELDAEVGQQAFPLRADEAHRQQHEVGFQLEVAALDLLELAGLHLDLVAAQPGDPAVAADELLGVDRVDPLAAFLVRGGHPEHQRVGRPRRRVSAGLRAGAA